MLRRLYAWTLARAESPHALLVLIAVSFAESSFFPVPPDILLIPMVLAQRKRALVLAAWCTAASVAGGIVGYGIGSLLYESVGKWIINLYGYANGVESFRQTYAEWGMWIILLKGLTPIPYKLVTIASGFSGYNFGLFVLLSIITRGIRFFVFASCAGLLWRADPRFHGEAPGGSHAGLPGDHYLGLRGREICCIGFHKHARAGLSCSPSGTRRSLIAGVGFASLASAWTFQFMGFEPCELCYAERNPYYFAVPAGLLAAMLADRAPKAAALLLAAICAAPDLRRGPCRLSRGRRMALLARSRRLHRQRPRRAGHRLALAEAPAQHRPSAATWRRCAFSAFRWRAISYSSPSDSRGWAARHFTAPGGQAHSSAGQEQASPLSRGGLGRHGDPQQHRSPRSGLSTFRHPRTPRGSLAEFAGGRRTRSKRLWHFWMTPLAEQHCRSHVLAKSHGIDKAG